MMSPTTWYHLSSIQPFTIVIIWWILYSRIDLRESFPSFTIQSNPNISETAWLDWRKPNWAEGWLVAVQWWWLMVLLVILVTFSLVLAIFHLCGIWLENATTTPPWKLHCHLHHHHLSRDHYHHYHLMSRMSLEVKYFWNAYNWVLICILESHHYQWSDRKVITDNLSREACLTRPLS